MRPRRWGWLPSAPAALTHLPVGVIAGGILVVYIALAIITAALVVKPLLSRMPEYVEQELRKAGAGEEVIDAIRRSYGRTRGAGSRDGVGSAGGAPASTAPNAPRQLNDVCKHDSPACDALIIQFIRQNAALIQRSRTVHRVYWADSDKYMNYAQGFSFSSLMTFSYNALGPGLLVFVTKGNTTIISILNCLLLALTVIAACRLLPINPLIFLVWIALNPMLFFSLTSVNKEILGFSSLVFAAIFLERKAWQYALLSLALAALARWPQFALLVGFFTIRWLNSRLSRSPRFMYAWLALALLLASVLYPIIRQQPALHMFFLMEKTWSAGQMQKSPRPARDAELAASRPLVRFFVNGRPKDYAAMDGKYLPGGRNPFGTSKGPELQRYIQYLYILGPPTLDDHRSCGSDRYATGQMVFIPGAVDYLVRCVYRFDSLCELPSDVPCGRSASHPTSVDEVQR